MKKLLLHMCCGPCAVSPLENLITEGVDVTLYFYDPNIHPFVEWQRRHDNAVKVSEYYNVPMITTNGCDAYEWRLRAHDGKNRCNFCYGLRLDNTCDYAAKHGFDAVSTTLLVSPYQDRELILKNGENRAAHHGVTFVPYDWRGEFRKGQTKAKEIGLYRQKYCGCVISLESSKFFDRISLEHDQLLFRQLNLSGQDLTV